MPWVLHFEGTSAPGEPVISTGPSFEKQVFAITFPDIPEGTIVRYGDAWWRARPPAPANDIFLQRNHWAVWHNGQQLPITALGLGGAMVFRTAQNLGRPLLFRFWRFE